MSDTTDELAQKVADLLSPKTVEAVVEPTTKEDVVEEIEKVEETPAVEEEVTEETVPTEGVEEPKTEEVVTEPVVEETVVETPEMVETETVVDSSAADKAEIARLREELVNMTAVASALAALSDLIRQELAEPDFYDVEYLARMAASLRSWANWELMEVQEDDAETSANAMDMEAVKTDLLAFTEGFKKIIAYINSKSVAEYIETVVVSEKNSKKLAEHLTKFCKTRKEVDAKLSEAKALIKTVVSEDSIPAGKGIVSEPVIEQTEIKDADDVLSEKILKAMKR